MTLSDSEQKRKEFLSYLVQELRENASIDNFRRNVFNLLARIGLQLTAKKERFFENEDWNNPKLREQLLQKVEEFLDNHIK
jgi:hypothetical protein